MTPMIGLKAHRIPIGFLRSKNKLYEVCWIEREKLRQKFISPLVYIKIFKCENAKSYLISALLFRKDTAKRFEVISWKIFGSTFIIKVNVFLHNKEIELEVRSLNIFTKIKMCKLSNPNSRFTFVQNFHSFTYHLLHRNISLFYPSSRCKYVIFRIKIPFGV